MDEKELKRRTKRFAVDIIKLVEELPNGKVPNVMGHQLLRSGTSVGANYRAACRGRSKAEMAAKLGIVAEEADESMYWMELLVESGVVALERVKDLQAEAEELLSIVVASIKTLKFGRERR